jgi:hypothetical protein
VDVPRAGVPTVDVPSSAVDAPNPGSVGDNLSNHTPNPDTPPAPDVDVPGPRGNDGPPVGGTVPDAPSTPDTPRAPGDSTTADTPPGTGAVRPDVADTSSPGLGSLDDTPGGGIRDALDSSGNGPDHTPDGARPAEDAPYTGPKGTQSDGSWIGEDHGTRLDLDPADNAAADELLARAATAELTITPRMQSILGEHMEGYDFRLKSEDSLKRAIVMERAEFPNDPPETLTEPINDSVRYTANVPDRDYVRESQWIIDDMHAQGFEFQPPPKNAWNDAGNYQGINSTWRDPATGQLFEMQFHTPESFAAKQTTHDLYEQARLLPRRSPERLALMREQAEIFRNVPRPAGTAGIRFP